MTYLVFINVNCPKILISPVKIYSIRVKLFIIKYVFICCLYTVSQMLTYRGM